MAWGEIAVLSRVVRRGSLGAEEKRGSKRRLLSVLQERSVFTVHSRPDHVWTWSSVCFVRVVGKFDSEVSVESSAHEREGPGCCRDSIMVNL